MSANAFLPGKSLHGQVTIDATLLAELRSCVFTLAAHERNMMCGMPEKYEAIGLQAHDALVDALVDGSAVYR